jgi:Tol biopolymer transport system component
MNPRISASTVAFVLAATVGCSDATSPTQPIAAPTDAFAAKQATTSSRMLYYDFGNVWIVNDDGSGATALTISADGAFDPSWAPDGKRVLFNAYKGEITTSIYVMKDDGSAVTRITHAPAGGGDIRPTKFGKDVAFVRFNGASTDIYRVGLDGTGETRLVSGWNPAAHPGGTRLAYVSNGDIYEYNSVTGQSVNLTNTPAAQESDPSYSPNGKQIVFAASAPGISGIYVMRVDGTAVTRLAWTDVGTYELPKWSPDGKRIGFSGSPVQFGTYDIHVMNADGSGLTNISQSAATYEMLTAWAR